MRVVLIVLASAAIVGAQSADVERPKFEVASVKPNRSADRIAGPPFEVQPGGRFFANNVSLTAIIRAAYALQPWQIVDAPSWADFERFDITAISDRELQEAEEGRGRGQLAPVQLMLQSLLADRFNLRSHLEERQTQVYALVRGGRTNKLTPIICDADNRCGIRSMRPGGFSARGPLALLTSHLGQITGRTVSDETGVVGAFDINLTWSSDPDAVDGISIFTALSDQLGLRLETRKGTVSMLVIDAVDRPTSN